MTTTAITNVSVVTGDEIVELAPNMAVTWQDGTILHVGELHSDVDRVINGHGGTLVAGSIDLHIHGANGFDMMDGTTTSIEEVSVALAKTGCTSFLATSVTASFDDLVKFIQNVAAVQGKEPGARVVGIHLEGPYLNKKRKGMQNEAHLRNPDIDEMRRLLSYANGMVKMVTVAPELPGCDEMIQFLRSQGIIVSIAHSDANYEEAMAAFKIGVSHVTHCFNAMRSIHHREPGVVVAAWESPNVTCEAIVDNVHLHPAIIRLMHRNLGHNRMILVTDAMQAMGLGDGSYSFGGHTVNVQNGVARLVDGTLASSTVTMAKAVRNAVHDGIDLLDAVRMATSTPARVLGLHKKGFIRPGFDADLVLLGADLEASLVIVGGKIVEAPPIEIKDF